MELKKISLKEIHDVMSRDEMKKIMAGSGTPSCGDSCASEDDCTDPTCGHCISGAALDGGCGCATGD